MTDNASDYFAGKVVELREDRARRSALDAARLRMRHLQIEPRLPIARDLAARAPEPQKLRADLLRVHIAAASRRSALE